MLHVTSVVPIMSEVQKHRSTLEHKLKTVNSNTTALHTVCNCQMYVKIGKSTIHAFSCILESVVLLVVS